MANESSRERRLNFGVSASANYVGVTLSTSFGYNSSSSDQKSQKDSRQHSIQATRKATSRVRKDHQVSFRLESVAGTENQAVRVINNPSETEAMRVDYYQMMRKWQVDLYHHGLRMTYDIVIPTPGADLLAQQEHLRDLRARVNAPFAFDVEPGDIRRDNWQAMAAAPQADVEPPPAELLQQMQVQQISVAGEASEQNHRGFIEFVVNDTYQLAGLNVEVNTSFYSEVEESDRRMEIVGDPQLFWRSGPLALAYQHRGVQSATIRVYHDSLLRPAVFEQWQFQAWSALRSAAYAASLSGEAGPRPPGSASP